MSRLCKLSLGEFPIVSNRSEKYAYNPAHKVMAERKRNYDKGLQTHTRRRDKHCLFKYSWKRYNTVSERRRLSGVGVSVCSLHGQDMDEFQAKVEMNERQVRGISDGLVVWEKKDM